MIAIFCPSVYTTAYPLSFLDVNDCFLFGVLVLRSQHKDLVKFPRCVEAAYDDILFVHLSTCCQSVSRPNGNTIFLDVLLVNSITVT
jgi:hypothetical protein